VGKTNKTELESSFLGFGVTLRASQECQQDFIAKGISGRLGLIYEAHDVLLSVLASIHSREDRTVEEAEVTAKLHRASIHSAIIQGADVTQYAISTACYPQAAALIRQEIEAVEACEGLRSKRQKEGKTPRLKVLKYLGPHYGVLSSIAHLSRSDFLLNLNKITENGIDPNLVEPFEKELFCIHLLCLATICVDAGELRPFSGDRLLSDQEQAWLASVMGVLVDAEFLPETIFK
jgi:hypothetical protein